MRTITFQNVFDTPADPQGNYNEVVQTPDGRIWTYLHATEAISQYSVTERPAVTDVDTVSSSSNANGDVVFITESSAGWTVGDFQDNWVVVNDGTGEGQLGKIKDNTSERLELYVDYALSTDLDVSDSDIVIVPVPDAEELDASSTNAPINGVAQVAFASGDDGWFLIKGIGGVTIGDTAAEVDELVVPGSDAAGGAIGIGNDADREDESVIGKALVANTTADKATLVEVNIGGL